MKGSGARERNIYCGVQKDDQEGKKFQETFGGEFGEARVLFQTGFG
jgi:hypothetical protein